MRRATGTESFTMIANLGSLGRSLLLTLALPLAGAESVTQPVLSPVFGEHMVLQRGKNVRLWGWSTPGTHLNVDLAGHHANAAAAADGRWEVSIEAPAAGGPYPLTID